MATLLRSDWQSAVEDELRKHARSLQETAQRAQSVFQQPPTPDPQQVLQELQGYAQSVAEPVVQFGQQAPQVAGQAQQGVVQFGQQQQQNVADVQSQLQDYASQVVSFGQPPVSPPQPAAPVAVTAGEQPPTEASAGAPSVAAAPVAGGTFQDYARQAAQRVGIDPEIFSRQIQQESGFDPRAKSPAGATGIAQIMPETARGWGVDPNDPYASLDVAARNMAGYIDKYGGWENALRAYNAGPGRIQESRGFSETNTYVNKILGQAREAVEPFVQGARAVRAALPHAEEPGSNTDALGDKWKTQFGFKATYTGDYRMGTPHRGVDLVPQRGGIGTAIEAFHPGTVSLIQRDSGGAGGLMVYVKDADGLTHAYMHLAGTRPGLKVGDAVNRGDFIASMGESGTEGSPHLHYEVRRGLSGDPLDQLIDPRPYMAGAMGAPTSTEQRAASVVDLGQRPEAKQPLIVGEGSTQGPTIFGEQGRRPAFEVVQDVAGEARRAAEQAAERVIAAAQEARQAAEPARQWVTGESQEAARAQGFSPEFQERARQATQPIQVQGTGEMLGSLLPFGPGAAPGPGSTVAPAEVAQQREKINQAIETHPAFQDWPVPVAAGVGIVATQMLLDPLTYATWGPLMRGGAAVGRAVTEATGREMLGKLSASAVTNGLQNALYEAQRPNPDPLEVGKQFAMGAIGGPVLELGAPALVRAGRTIIENADQVRPLLAARQRGEAEVGFALGMPTGGRPEPTGFQAPEAEPPARRMYHGTGAEFERPELGRLDPNGLFGPGYYLTSEPRVAGGLVRGETEPLTAVQQSLIDRGLLTPENARNRAGAVLEPGYAQNVEGTDYIIQQDIQRLRRELDNPALSDRRRYAAEQGILELEGKLGRATAGPNVRAVDVPADVRLLDAEVGTPLPEAQRLITAAAAALERDGDTFGARSVRRYLDTINKDVRSDNTVDTGRLIQRLYGDARLAAGRPTNDAAVRSVQSALVEEGYDGIAHSGGQRVPMFDAAGKAIEHDVNVIFPDSLPKIRNAISGRQGGQAQAPFALDIGGAAAGAYAGNVATPEEAPPEERLRNIGIGAGVGLLGGRLAGRRLGPPGELALARAEPGGFRAPAIPRPGDNLLRATTTESPSGPAPREPRRLGEVHSNRWLLGEADEGATPLTEDEIMAHAEELERRFEDVRARSEAVDEILRNPNQKPYRPSWAAGWTNEALVELARKNGVSAYDEAWDQRLGFDPGSGEMKYDVGESGLRGTGARELTPAELRAEQKTLAQEQADLTAAYDQLTSAPAGSRFARRPVGDAARGDLPFDGGPVIAEGAVENGGPSGNLAEDIVTRNGSAKRPSGLKGLWQEPGQVVARKNDVVGRGVADADVAGTGQPDVETKRLMPNLDAMLGDEMPEVRAQIQKAVEDNPELFEAYQQGRISHDSLKDDLARRVGMSKKDWLKTPVGKGFSTPELVALQAAAIDAQTGTTDMAREILNRGGVDQLTPEEVAFSISNLFDTTRLLAVARGGRASAGRSLNALKNRMDRQLARDISTSNEHRAAKREADAARRGAVKAARILDKTRDLELEAKQAQNGAREAGVPKNIEDEIMDAYAQLDRYQAMSLHEKADDFNKLAKERAERAANRKARVREAPEELLSALKAELAAERKIFAGRKDTWETMAFWDSKAEEIAAEKRAGFRGGLYLEQQRKAAQLAEKANEERARRAWDAEMRRSNRQTQKATAILEAIGGEQPSKDLLKAFTEAVAADDPMVAAKFLKGLSRPQTGFGYVVELARNANIMRLAGMLSSTATHLINAGGNAIQVGLEVGTRAAIVPIDIARSASTGGERQAYAAEILPMLQAYGPGFLGAWGDVKRALTTGIGPSEVADLSTLRPGFRTGLPGRAGEAVDTAIEMPLRVLKGSDLLFRGGAFAMHAQRVAVRRATQEGFRGAQRTGRANSLVANLEDYPELYREVAEQAARMVFQERRTVPGISGVKIKGTAADLGELAVSQVVPFRATPANIFAQGFGLGPTGLAGVAEAMGARGSIAAKVASGELAPERLGRQTLLAQERAARVVIGTGILGMGYILGTQKDDQGKPRGMLTAMYDEDEASTYPPGWRAWSMRNVLPDEQIEYIPFQNFGAAGVPLAMSALLTDAERRGRKVWEGDELMRAATGLGRYALDNTFLQGVSDWVDLLHDPKRSGGKFVEGLVSSYGPYSAMGRQIQRAQGVASRNPREGWLGLLDALEANYPGTSANVPEATTPLGTPRVAGATELGALVGRYDIERDEPTLAALRAVDVNVPAEPKSVTIGGGYGVELTEAERDTLKRARGTAIRQAVEGTLKNPNYQKLEATLRREQPGTTAYQDALSRAHAALQAAVSGAAQSANNDLLRTLGDTEMRRRMKVTRELEPTYLGAAD